MERTLVILKPDALQRGIVGDIITRFERVGLKLIGSKMMEVNKDLANKHYPKDRRHFIEGMGHKTLKNYEDQNIDPVEHFGHEDAHKIGLEVQKWLVDFLTSGPVLVTVWEGPHAIELIRKLSGNTLPAKAEPGTIRGDYSFDSSFLANANDRSIRNLIHASGDKEEAEFEINLWFNKDELYNYDTVHQKHMVK